MKNLILICVSLCFVLLNVAIGTADMVGQFRLDGNAIDSSGHGNHGTINGSVATIDRFGNAGRAMAFDGVDDRIDISQLLFDGDDATVAFWAKSFGTQSSLTVMVSQGHWGADAPADTGFAFQFAWPTSQETSLIYGDNVGGAHSWNRLSLDIDIEADTDWHHFAFTKSGNLVTAYRDGIATGAASSGLAFGNYGFSIGADTFNSGRNFSGSIDSLNVYNTALSTAQINQIMAIPEPSATLTIFLLCLAGLVQRNRN